MLYLSRHGVTNANTASQPIVQGQKINLPLSKLGRLQCESLAKQASSASVKAIYCSPLRRAVESAEIVAKELRIDISVVNFLVEGNFGDWEGMTWEEIQTQYSEEYKILRNVPESFRYPNGDSFRDIFLRADVFFRTLDSDENTLVITHSIVIATYVAYGLGAKLPDVLKWDIAHCVMYDTQRLLTDT